MTTRTEHRTRQFQVMFPTGRFVGDPRGTSQCTRGPSRSKPTTARPPAP